MPEAKVYHIGCATTGSKFNDLTIRLSTRNSLYILMKNYPLLLFLRLLPVIFIYQFLWFLFVVKKKQAGPYLKGLYQAMVGANKMMSKRSRQDHVKLGINEYAAVLKSAEMTVFASIMRRRQSLGKGNRIFHLYKALFL